MAETLSTDTLHSAYSDDQQNNRQSSLLRITAPHSNERQLNQHDMGQWGQIYTNNPRDTHNIAMQPASQEKTQLTP